MRNGIAACRAQGNGWYLPVLTTALAEAEAYAGEVDAASLTIETAITETELEAETRRTHGEILLRRPGKYESRRGSVREALAIAQKRKQAHGIFAPVYASFLGDINTPELHEAKALLSELKP